MVTIFASNEFDVGSLEYEIVFFSAGKRIVFVQQRQLPRFDAIKFYVDFNRSKMSGLMV